MPAEGAMSTRLEAPVQEPRNVAGQGEVILAAVTRTFSGRGGAPVPALAGLTLRVEHGEIVAV
ncbi:MAG TPA: hypothetical protein VFR49_15420, partial [Solirubrobacteraceae bacterium]|nr:hypothetical protein [Solirubrobacteraceae bacterium]